MAPPCDCLIRFPLVSVGLAVFQRRFPVLGDREGVSVFTPVCERKPRRVSEPVCRSMYDFGNQSHNPLPTPGVSFTPDSGRAASPLKKSAICQRQTLSLRA